MLQDYANFATMSAMLIRETKRYVIVMSSISKRSGTKVTTYGNDTGKNYYPSPLLVPRSFLDHFIVPPYHRQKKIKKEEEENKRIIYLWF